jgi:hypothetical protein
MSYGVVPPTTSILDGTAYKRGDGEDEDAETQSLLAKVGGWGVGSACRAL